MKICEAGRDSCGCDNWKKGIRTINGQYTDDNRDFDINAGSGILITPATAGITITNEMGAVTAGDNIVVTPSGDHLIVALAQNIAIGNLDVAGDIIQHGAAYETHMEKVYTVNDYIIMRDGAVSGLQNGEYSGFQVKKYDGTNDGRLVIDNTGTARVGDVGDEQPLLTREESADLTDGAILKWDAANSKAVDEGTIGDDTHPVKTVNGILTPVTDELAKKTQVLPRNGSSIYFMTTFGSNVYNGEYYSTFIGLPNADRVTITLTGMGVIGVSWWTGSTLESKVRMGITAYGITLYCNDSSVVGKACNPQFTITNGSD